MNRFLVTFIRTALITCSIFRDIQLELIVHHLTYISGLENYGERSAGVRGRDVENSARYQGQLHQIRR